MRAAGRKQISTCFEPGYRLAVFPRHSFGRIRLQFAGVALQATVHQIASGFRMVMELELVKGGCLPQQLGNGSGCQFLFEKRHRLAERQIEEAGRSGSGSPPRSQA